MLKELSLEDAYEKGFITRKEYGRLKQEEADKEFKKVNKDINPIDYIFNQIINI